MQFENFRSENLPTKNHRHQKKIFFQLRILLLEGSVKFQSDPPHYVREMTKKPLTTPPLRGGFKQLPSFKGLGAEISTWIIPIRQIGIIAEPEPKSDQKHNNPSRSSSFASRGRLAGSGWSEDQPTHQPLNTNFKDEIRESTSEIGQKKEPEVQKC